jgi:hypothetical protein
MWRCIFLTLGVDEDGTIHAAWTDLRAREPDTNVFYARSGGGGDSFEPSERVDDGGEGGSEQTAPQIAWARKRCFVVWEDNRNGTSDIYLGRRKCRA